MKLVLLFATLSLFTSIAFGEVASLEARCSPDGFKKRVEQSQLRSLNEWMTKVMGQDVPTSGMGYGSYGSIPNGSPIYTGAGMVGAGGYGVFAPVETDGRSFEDRQLDFRIAMARVLKDIPTTVFSEKFKAALLANPVDLYPITNGDEYRSDEISLPWPANDSTAPIRTVKSEDYPQALAGLSAEQKKKLTEIVDSDPRYAENRRLRREAAAKSALASAPASAKAQSTNAATGAGAPTHVLSPERRDPSGAFMNESEIAAFGQKAKAYVIQAISQGQPESRLSVGQRAMIARIRNFTIRQEDEVNQHVGFGENLATLSLVRGADHSVEMGQLIHRMTGELSDCSLQTPQYRVSALLYTSIPQTYSQTRAIGRPPRFA